MLLLFVAGNIPFNESFAQKAGANTGNASPNEKELRDCSVSFYSSILEKNNPDENSGSCKSYTLLVNYTGTKSYGLSHLTVGHETCGTASSVSNTGNWPMELNFDEPTTSLYGFKVDDVSNFGEGSSPQTFSVDFTLCSEDLSCMNGDCTVTVAYKAGQCIYYENLPISCLNGSENTDTDDESDDEGDDDEDQGDEEDDEDDEQDEDTPDTEHPRDCSESYTGFVSAITSEEGNCKTYQLTVNYNGIKSYGLSNVAIGIPCGEATVTTNSGGWPVEVNATDPNTNLYGFKVDNISGFGEGENAQSFTTEFMLCSEDITCLSNDCAITVAYKAGQCIYYQDISIPCIDHPDVVQEEDPEEEDPEVEDPEVEDPEVEDPEVEDPEVEVTVPTAKLLVTEDKLTICQGEEVTVDVQLTGNGPWTLEYSDGKNIHVIHEITEEIYELKINKDGTYSLVDVSDGHGVDGEAIGVLDVEFNEAPDAEITGGGWICQGEESEVNFNLKGKGPWTLTYTDGLIEKTVQTEESIFTILADKTSIFKVLNITDQFCANYELKGEIEVNIKESPRASIKGGGEICEGQTAGIDFELEGEGPWTINYTDGVKDYSILTESNSYHLDVSEPGEYAITSIQNENCTGTFEGTVIVKAAVPLKGTLFVDQEQCANEEIEIILKSNHPNPAEVEWETDGDGEFTSKDAERAVYLPTDFDKEITFTAHLRDKCESQTLSASTVIIKPAADFGFEPKVEKIITKVEYTFVPTYDEGDSYTWTYSDGAEDHTLASVHTFENSGNYTVTLHVEEGSCSMSETVEIVVHANANLFVPSVFNPESSSEENSVVRVYGEDIANEGFAFEIFNRWGKIVYKTHNFDEARSVGWDGTRKNEAQENGVYTYVLRGRFNSGEFFEKTGTITLVK